MPKSIPVLFAELLGFATGTVLSAVLVLLVRRSAHRSPGTPLLCICALAWNVFGLAPSIMLLSGMPADALPVALAHAACLTGGALFPISFLQMWWRPQLPGRWQSTVNRWLLRAAKFNALWISALLFACPFVQNPAFNGFTTRVPAWNAALLLTIGAFTLLRGRLRAAADRICLTLTLGGIWGSTAAIFLHDYVAVSPRIAALLVIAKSQSPFLAVLGALFFFARIRSSDVLLKASLRVVAAVSIGVWTFFFLDRTLPGLTATLGAFPPVAHAAVATALIASLLLLFCLMDRQIVCIVDCWLLRQPDFRLTLRDLWERMVRIDSETDLFVEADGTVSRALHLGAARILARADFPAIEVHAAANAGRVWELACDDPCRRLLSDFEIDVLAPVRVHGEITHVIAVAPGPSRRSLLHTDLDFVANVAGQIGSRLEALAHDREKFERQSREATLRRLAAQAELKALRAQVNPHFLFNSLNTIADLIVTDPPKAEAITVRLAKVFRHVLMQSDRQLTRVAEEMDFLRTYLGIEQVRFGARLCVDMEIDPTVSDEPIPSLILQPVVENAIKYAVAPKVAGGRLSITAARQGEFVRLAVEDDGAGAAPAVVVQTNGNGVGLKIIAERLRELYHGRASLNFHAEPSGSRVTILIPRSEAAV